MSTNVLCRMLASTVPFSSYLLHESTGTGLEMYKMHYLTQSTEHLEQK